jgi:hypothetical protein
MGSRANYVVVDGSGYRVHYSHWGAQSLDLDLLPGPEHALAFIDAQERTDGEWLDDTWAEGAALVDTVRRELVWFGGFEFAYMLPYRRACLAVLARTWPGWTIRWAHDELGDLVRHVGVPLEVIRKPELTPDPEQVLGADSGRGLAPPDGDALAEGWWVLLTVRPPDGPARAHVFDDFSVEGELVLAGEALLARLPAPGDGVTEVRGAPPRHGLHVDLGARTVGWWSAPPAPRTTGEAPPRWPGWRVETWQDPPWQDGYDRQRAAVADDVSLPAVDLLAGLDELEQRLGRARHDPVAAFDATTEALRAAGHEVEVLAPVSAHTEVPPDDAGADRLAAALADVRREVRGRP